MVGADSLASLRERRTSSEPRLPVGNLEGSRLTVAASIITDDVARFPIPAARCHSVTSFRLAIFMWDAPLGRVGRHLSGRDHLRL
jgi:hypothetical protein